MRARKTTSAPNPNALVTNFVDRKRPASAENASGEPSVAEPPAMSVWTGGYAQRQASVQGRSAGSTPSAAEIIFATTPFAKQVKIVP